MDCNFVTGWSIFAIGVSITVFCLETLPQLKEQVHNVHLSSMKNTTAQVCYFICEKATLGQNKSEGFRKFFGRFQY